MLGHALPHPNVRPHCLMARLADSSTHFLSRNNPRRGFALLITVTLLAFLVLLLVSLASLTRVETQVAANTQQIAHARQNALLALNIALGQLQKYAGPDQRVTATADLVADTDKTGTATPSPLFASTTHIKVKPGARYWTAAWGNTESVIRYDRAPNQIPPTTTINGVPPNRRGVTPGLLNWLISGNESAVFTTNAAGGIVAGTGLSYAPADAIDLSDLSHPTVKGTPAVILVGPNAIGTGANAEKDYVVAPLVSITAPASLIPGADPGTSESPAPPIPVGRYAWWVGDEGVKARINLQNGYQKISDPSERSDAQINTFITSQRSAIEFMDRDPSGTTSPTRIGTDFDFTNTSIPRILSASHLSFSSTDVAAQARLASTAKNRFHDLTATSYGLLSDTYAGGLKKDLTADIADNSNDASYRPADTSLVFPSLSAGTVDPYHPTWGLIRNWARINPVANTNPITPVVPTPTNGGIYPTIAYFSLGFNYDLEGGVSKMVFYPIISLHNPYPQAIAAANYEVAIRFGPNARFTIQIDPNGEYVRDGNGTVLTDPVFDSNGNPVIDANGQPVTTPRTDINYTDYTIFNLHNIEATSQNEASTAIPTFFRLKIRGQSIPPGQRHLYVLPDSLHNTAYNYSAPPILERAPDTALGLGESNYFTLPGPVIDLSAVNQYARVRLRVSTGNEASGGIKYADMSLALGANNAFGSSTTWNPNATGIYQAMLGVYPTVSHLLNFANTTGFSAGNGFYCTTQAVGDLVSAKQIPPTNGTSAFRMATGYEAGGWWSSQWKMGFVHGFYPSRFVADGTLRARHIMATSLENYDQRPDGNNRGIDDRVAAGIFGARFADANQDQGRDPHPGVGYYRYTTGVDGGPDNGNTTEGTRYAILWDVLESPDRLLSLGQLQHVPFSRYDFQPSYLFGNSYANKRIPRNLTYRSSKLRRGDQEPTVAPSIPIFDTSWLLNRALWDRYFVSGVPSTWTQTDIDNRTPLPNARMTYYAAGGQQVTLNKIKFSGGTNTAYDAAAANLLVAGAFNINSTSEQAWRAIFAGTYRIPLNSDYAQSGDTVDATIPYPRFSHNLVQSGDTVYPARPVTMKPYPAVSGSGDGQFSTKVRNTMYLGNRGLFLNLGNNAMPEHSSADTIVAELARAMVQEIRFRGPFLSLSDFVNRPLIASEHSVPSDPPTTGHTPDAKAIAGIKGALQAAMDNMNPAVAQVNPVTYQQKGTSGYKTGQAYPRYDWDSENAVGGFINTDPSNTFPSDQVHRSPFAMAPKMLTQGDILSSLGPMLSPRSDTFTIRTYGEKINPVTQVIEGRAWCEAVVQRLPDYVDSTQAATATATGVNVTYGRRFQVVSLRWLSPQDI